MIWVEALKARHASNVFPLTDLAAKIEWSERSLRDQEILMKIIVTEPMMANYQRNEYPNIKTMESVKRMIDSLTEDVVPYANYQK